MPVYCSVDTESGVEDLETCGLIPPRQHVTLDFGNGVEHPHYVKYMTYFMNTTTLMRQLTAEVARLNIPIERRTVTSFVNVQENIIFNCAGLGTRELNQDHQMVPVRGHLITLNENAGEDHMQYMIYTKVQQDGKDAYIYLFSKNISVLEDNIDELPCGGVLGGTFIPHVDKLSQEEQNLLETFRECLLDQVAFKHLLDRNAIFFYGHNYQD